MRNGICPRCGTSEVYAARNALAIGDTTEVALHQHIEPGFRGMRPRIRTDGWSFLCAGCGLLELYALDGSAREFVRQTWLRVPVAPAPAASP